MKNKFAALSPRELLSPKSRKRVERQIVALKSRESNDNDKKFVEDRIIRSYLTKNEMTVPQLRDVIHKIQMTWRQVTALILFRSVVMKAKRMTDYMLNHHHPTQMSEYRYCLSEYRRICTELITATNEKENAIRKLNKDINHMVEIEALNFDSELDALSQEYETKLKK
eukprot:529709_1